MATSKTLLAVFFFGIYLSACSQKSNQLNPIDTLKTGKEAFAFLEKYLPEYKGNKTFEKYRNETRQTADSFNVRDWVKTDIDNNGETDLLIFRADKLPTIFAVLSFKGNFIPIAATYSVCKYQFVYPVVTSLNNENVIFLYNQGQVDYDQNTKHFLYTKISCDTLVVKDKLFVNYVPTPNRHEIEAIEIYNDGMCEGNCPRMKIDIDARALTSKCSKELYWDNKPRSFTGQVAREQIKQIVRLVDYANFSELSNEYAVECTDQPTTTITIRYGGGYTKAVHDYGSSGNFTLSEIYKIAFGIKWTENKDHQ